MSIPTEAIGSIPRPAELLKTMMDYAAGKAGLEALEAAQTKALRETIERLEATGSPIITDGEQTKPSFATYPIHGAANLASDGVVIPFADGHTRQLPRLTGGPFRYQTYASSYVKAARQYTARPIKQAVISASALSLLYPQNEIAGYSREQFVSQLLDEAEKDIRGCLEAGAAVVQVDFTEGRLALKLDPSGALLRQFVDLNNRVFDRFSTQELRRIGVHTCPGGDRDSTHSAGVDYAGLLPLLFQMHAGNFYVQLASEPDRQRVLGLIRQHAGPDQRIFVGVIDPINPLVESPQEVCDRLLEAANYLPVERLGATDDCGFSPFSDDVSTARETAFQKIAARVAGVKLAQQRLGAS